MPAAELSKLQAQIRAISTQFEEPRIFLRSLLTLMELYSDQNYKPGDLSRVKHLIPEYRLPALVIQQLTDNLASLTASNPNSAIQIMDTLWQEKHFEARLIAAAMLSNLPAQSIEHVMDRIQKWAKPEEDEDLISALLISSNRFFSIDKMEVWLHQIHRWLSLENEGMIKIGLKALLVILNDPEFVNSEKIFALLEPTILHPNFSLQKEIFSLIELLVNHSEMETTAFLRSILAQTNNAEVVRFIRRCLPLLGQNSQASLKSFMNPPK